jgi:hypothetical protein
MEPGIIKDENFYIKEGLSALVVEKCKQYDQYKLIGYPRMWLDNLKVEIDHIINLIESRS